jgi:hypothetical protein
MKEPVRPHRTHEEKRRLRLGSTSLLDSFRMWFLRSVPQSAHASVVVLWVAPWLFSPVPQPSDSALAFRAVGAARAPGNLFPSGCVLGGQHFDMNTLRPDTSTDSVAPT